MTIMSFLTALAKKREKESFAETMLGQAFTDWKVAYGFAIHGNYTFDLPLEEISRRWDKAHEAERGLVRILLTLASLTKVRSEWIHIIEAEIVRLETERKLVLAGPTLADKSRVDHINQRLEEAYILLMEAKNWEG